MATGSPKCIGSGYKVPLFKGGFRGILFSLPARLAIITKITHHPRSGVKFIAAGAQRFKGGAFDNIALVSEAGTVAGAVPG